MIRVRDLTNWAQFNAVGCTLECPDGWISGDDLKALAEAVINRAPFDYMPVYKRPDQQDTEGDIDG